MLSPSLSSSVISGAPILQIVQSLQPSRYLVCVQFSKMNNNLWMQENSQLNVDVKLLAWHVEFIHDKHCHYRGQLLQYTPLQMWRDTYRCRAWYFVVHHDTEKSTCWHHWARLRAAGWTAEAGGADSQTVQQDSLWRQSSVWTKWRRAGSADVGGAVRQVSKSLATNSSTTRGELYHAKRRSEIQWCNLSWL